MSEAKRYEAVHLRYDDNNIRYGDGCEVEVVLAADYATLEAENAKLRAELERRAVDGWKLVPVEPTEEMLRAGVDAAIAQKNSRPWCPPCYRAMLAAAPSAPKADDPVKVRLLEALEFYANGNHILLADEDAWDTCSGEPMNWLHDDAGTASVEDGSLAKAAIAAARQEGGKV